MSDHAPVVIREYENRVVNNKSGLAETVKRHQNKQRPMTAVHPTKQLRKAMPSSKEALTKIPTAKANKT